VFLQCFGLYVGISTFLRSPTIFSQILSFCRKFYRYLRSFLVFKPRLNLGVSGKSFSRVTVVPTLILVPEAMTWLFL